MIKLIFVNKASARIQATDNLNVVTELSFLPAELEYLVGYMMTNYENNLTYYFEKTASSIKELIIEHPSVSTANTVNMDLNILDSGKYKPETPILTYLKSLV